MNQGQEILHQVILAGGLPFEVKNPQYNAETIAAIQEARDIIAGKIPADLLLFFRKLQKLFYSVCIPDRNLIVY